MVAARTDDEVLDRETDVVPTAAVKAVVPTVLFEKSAVVVDALEDAVVVELLRVMTHEVVTLLESI